jgi:hypothetical protein
VTLFEITQGQRAGWQRRAAAELAAILDAHRDLPAIAWTVGPAGATVVGCVHGLAGAGRVRDMFHTWRSALAFVEHGETVSVAGTAFLRASVTRNCVLLVLTATVFDRDDEADAR